MSSRRSSPENWFERGGEAYARFRPGYPDQLAASLAALAPSRQLAVDVGCGNGQLTRQLACHFDAVLGCDASAEQIANAVPAPGVSYRCAPAEALPVADGSVSLLVAAQAAHWFDLPAFYAEVRRAVVPGGVVALISYGVLQFEPALDARFQRFYRDEIGAYWPPERRLVDTGYATLDFPFAEMAAPPLSMRVLWSLPQLLGYLSTWSAVRRAGDAGQEALLRAFADDFAALWGDPQGQRALAWPIAMRLGKR